MERTAVDVVVTGRVQGVYFRAAAEQQAARLDVTGWVTNEPDGSVHLHAEGYPDAVDQLVAWCHQGPSQARVEDVEVTPAADTGARAFEVRG